MASILIKTGILQAKGLSSTHSQRSRASIWSLLTTLSTWHSAPVPRSLVLWPLGRFGRGPWSTCGTTLQRRPSSLCTVPWTLAPVEGPYCLSVLTRGTASQCGVGQGDDVNEAVAKLNAKIMELEQEIQETKEEIKEKKQQIKEKEQKGENDQLLIRLYDEKKQLMDEKKQLMDEKKQLMDEKKQLMEENKTLQVTKRRKFMTDGCHVDDYTSKYFESISSQLPKSSEELKLFLKTAQPRKFNIRSDTFELFIQSSIWEPTVYQCSNIDDNLHNCDALEQMLISIITHFRNIWSLQSENSMITSVDIYTLPVVLLYGCSISRNVCSTSSGSYRPDFFIAPSGPPLFVGEDKLSSNYYKGRMGHDPVLENESKIPWDMWEDFWGDIPYIFAYAAVGAPSYLEFVLGVLEHKKKKFVPLGQFDIRNRNQIPELWLTYMKLLPVFKALHEVSRSTAKNQVPYYATKITNLLHGRNVTIEKKICALNGAAVFHKCWTFSNDSDATAFLCLQRKIFNTLKTLNSPSFVHESEGSSFHFSDDNTSVIKVYFSPWGQKCVIETLDQLIQAVLSISKAVKLMHSVGIVHNDLRWDNVILHKKNYVLIDFDDAYILSENDFCPGLFHLSSSEHSANTFKPHRFEVDIWGIGRLILTKLSDMKEGSPKLQGSLRDLGHHLTTCCTDVKLIDVISTLESLQPC